MCNNSNQLSSCFRALQLRWERPWFWVFITSGDWRWCNVLVLQEINTLAGWLAINWNSIWWTFFKCDQFRGAIFVLCRSWLPMTQWNSLREDMVGLKNSSWIDIYHRTDCSSQVWRVGRTRQDSFSLIWRVNIALCLMWDGWRFLIWTRLGRGGHPCIPAHWKLHTRIWSILEQEFGLKFW